jgi:CRISPR-associated endoribonuclease Cas6
MQKLKLDLEPETDIVVPNSDGYSIYSALLSVLKDHNPDLSKRVHDDSIAAFHNSGLLGSFGSASRKHHKKIHGGNTYNLTIGIPFNDDELYRGFADQFENDVPIPVNDGEFRVTDLDITETTHQELYEEAGELTDPCFKFNFQSPTCIEVAPKITTLNPGANDVFMSLQRKWNEAAPDHLGVAYTEHRIRSNVTETEVSNEHPTYNVVVNRYTDDDGEIQNIFSHGFGGTASYGFRDADSDLKHHIAALAKFAEYSGIGIATSRGCGAVDVTIN